MWFFNEFLINFMEIKLHIMSFVESSVNEWTCMRQFCFQFFIGKSKYKMIKMKANEWEKKRVREKERKTERDTTTFWKANHKISTDVLEGVNKIEASWQSIARQIDRKTEIWSKWWHFHWNFPGICPNLKHELLLKMATSLEIWIEIIFIHFAISIFPS